MVTRPSSRGRLLCHISFGVSGCWSLDGSDGGNSLQTNLIITKQREHKRETPSIQEDTFAPLTFSLGCENDNIMKNKSPQNQAEPAGPQRGG